METQVVEATAGDVLTKYLMKFLFGDVTLAVAAPSPVVEYISVAPSVSYAAPGAAVYAAPASAQVQYATPVGTRQRHRPRRTGIFTV